MNYKFMLLSTASTMIQVYTKNSFTYSLRGTKVRVSPNVDGLISSAVNVTFFAQIGPHPTTIWI